MINVITVAEDQITTEILKRLLDYSKNHFNVLAEHPVRGGQIISKIQNYNELAEKSFVILLTDLNGMNCPLELINKWFGTKKKNSKFIINIAYDEAESWLMADREGISKYLNVPLEYIPMPTIVDNHNTDNTELKFKYKPSLFLINELVPKINNNELKRQLSPRELAKKGPEYNIVMTGFILSDWDIENASQNSYSLRKTMQRLNAL